MKMKIMERNVIRLVAVQHLRSAYGIKTKNWNKNKSGRAMSSSSTKIFGVPLDSLPHYNMEQGRVPSFLVDACMKLLAHVDTEGLFRKSGSVVRLKALRTKLDAGEECLSSALPCDVAGLVKQFFRELPEPALPTELHEALLKAQQLPTEEDKISATLLLSCVLPDRNLSTLRHFFDFLHNVSNRSAHNKMDSSNLSLILAPNLLHLGDGMEKMNASAEKCLKLQAAVVHCFIEHARDFGVLPRFLMEKVPDMMGCGPGVLSPLDDGLEELDATSGIKKRCRRSFGDVVNGALNKLKTNRTPTHTTESDSVVFSSATPVIATPSSKRKLPMESGQSFGFSNKKRRSIIKNLGIDLLPNTLFNGPSTPGSAYSTSEVLDSPQNTMSSGQSGRKLATSARRKSRRMSHRNAINRVESGRSGCFSPKVKKEGPRKSLRLRFSLGKSTKDTGSESIGLRLATLEHDSSFAFTKVTGFSPAGLQSKTESKSSKYISKSEDNLLTPQYISSVNRDSWVAETPEVSHATVGGSFTDTPLSRCLKTNYHSEPAIVVSKPPTGASLPKTLCCVSTEDNLESEGSLSVVQREPQTGPTVLKIKTPLTESGFDLWPAKPNLGEHPSKLSERTLMPPPVTPVIKVSFVDISTPQRQLAVDPFTFGQLEMLPLSPLHIDSTLIEPGGYCSSTVKADDGSVCIATVGSPNNSMLSKNMSQAERMNCSSRLIEALDMESPIHFKLGVAVGLQSTPCMSSRDFSDHINTGSAGGARSDMVCEQDVLSTETGNEAQNQLPVLPESLESDKARVADHIQRFNKLTLLSPKAATVRQVRSPLKFQRTPVKQAVRRINSLQGDNRRATRALVLCADKSSPMSKAVSLDSGLYSGPLLRPRQGDALAAPPNAKIHPMKKPPPVPPPKPGTLARIAKSGVLGDVTNVLTIPANKTESFRAQKPHGHQMGEREVYRGSPRNPIIQGRLLSATKPIDL